MKYTSYSLNFSSTFTFIFVNEIMYSSCFIPCFLILYAAKKIIKLVMNIPFSNCPCFKGSKVTIYYYNRVFVKACKNIPKYTHYREFLLAYNLFYDLKT